MEEDLSESKERAGDGGAMPPKTMRCNNLTDHAEHTEASEEDRVAETHNKRKTSVVQPPVQKTRKTRCSINNTFYSGTHVVCHDGKPSKNQGRRSNASDPSVIVVKNLSVESQKTNANDDGEAPKKKLSTRSTDVKRDVSSDEDAGDVNQNLSSASSQEEKIFEMSSSANTSTADFEDKYYELCRLGAGGYGYVYDGLRKSDNFPVAIKHIPKENVRWEQVICNGKEFKIILEVAFMLKAAGLPGSVGQSAAVSLLDWYILDEELILVMENPVNSIDLWDYIESQGGSLEEHKAKMILKQLVDAAIDMHSKNVFHRDIKLENVLIQKISDVPRVRIIDFGCGCFSTDTPYDSFCGTLAHSPPEWIQCQKYWARPTTVWQLGVLFYSLLKGHVPFTTAHYINNDIKFNTALSTDVRILLRMCLTLDPKLRSSLEELKQSRFLNNPALCLPSDILYK
ncbi:Serine/threonine-protein kinase par-1 [Larimichthys crocea]|uniref:non-specific serine/threonine protein kinase n=1 Tax=Larimichthys crocea TaxID=215358 RepID=A0A6G0J1K4_LARCR|nr:Serine/threonine-protein kinase par-1 [Larimichthys crocea]